MNGVAARGDGPSTTPDAAHWLEQGTLAAKRLAELLYQEIVAVEVRDVAVLMRLNAEKDQLTKLYVTCLKNLGSGKEAFAKLPAEAVEEFMAAKQAMSAALEKNVPALATANYVSRRTVDLIVDTATDVGTKPKRYGRDARAPVRMRPMRTAPVLFSQVA